MQSLASFLKKQSPLLQTKKVPGLPAASLAGEETYKNQGLTPTPLRGRGAMNRREFIAKSCLACAGAGILSVSITGCASHYVAATIETNGLSILKTEFLQTKSQAYKTFLLVQHEQLAFPIYVYRFSDSEYTALWMECTHQGAELQASGDFLHCPSHGSEFTNRGAVSSGPSEKNLRSFPVSISNEKIFIDLRT